MGKSNQSAINAVKLSNGQMASTIACNVKTITFVENVNFAQMDIKPYNL